MTVATTTEEMEALDALVSLGRGVVPARQRREPTTEDVVNAAWGNLRVEEKDVTIDDARRIISGAG